MRPLIMTSSGTRGIIGENLTPEIALKTAVAFATYIKTGTIIVGGDTRTSYDMLKNAVIAGITSIGLNVIDIGKVPTPTVQQLIRYYNADGGVVITASHNPIIWNGLKLMSKSGSFLEPEEYEEFLQYYQGQQPIQYAAWDNVGKIQIDTQALAKHVDTVLSVLDVSSLKKRKLKVLIDPNNGAGAVANPILLDKLNIDYEMINGEPNGIFEHNPEPLKKNLGTIIAKMKAGNYDIGFVQDADADRLVILDEHGEFIGEDYSLGLCIEYILAQEKSSSKEVVVNLSTSRVIDYLAKKYQANLIHTKIGETNVTKALRARQATVGGEGNGGVIYPKVGWGRDSLVGIVIALKYLAESGKTVSQIVANYPRYYMLREKFTVANKEEIQPYLDKIEKQFCNEEINKLDGIKIIYPDSWIHVRPSNTEPIIRIFIEAPTQAKAEEMLENLKGTK